ncbi:MAG: outer membrane protein assembly factor BamD [Elusimicrobiota bacterium]|jgi:TolA-binding protein|nr:outer membrane protein assembly factor BamD [Elusimicrobiota bacterium]
MNYKYFLLISILILFVFNGCIATKQDLLNVNLEVRELRKEVIGKLSDNINLNIEIRNEFVAEIEKLQKINADIRDNIDNQVINIDKLGGKVEEGNYRFQDIKFNQEYLDALDKKLAVIEDKLFTLLTSTNNIVNQSYSLSPEQIYQMARSDYSRGSYDLAISGFDNIIKNYPDSSFGENSYYDMSVAYYAKKDWEKVNDIIDIFISNYPSSQLVPKAYILKTKAFRKLGSFEKAKEVYNKILKDYPLTEEAKIAKDELDLMQA